MPRTAAAVAAHLLLCMLATYCTVCPVLCLADYVPFPPPSLPPPLTDERGSPKCSLWTGIAEQKKIDGRSSSRATPRILRLTAQASESPPAASCLHSIVRIDKLHPPHIDCRKPRLCAHKAYYVWDCLLIQQHRDYRKETCEADPNLERFTCNTKTNRKDDRIDDPSTPL